MPIRGFMFCLLLFVAASLCVACERSETAAPAAAALERSSTRAGSPSGPPAARAAVPLESSRSPNATPRVHEDLVRDANAPRHPADGLGRGWFVEPPGPRPQLPAGKAQRFVIEYEAGKDGIAVGGSLAIRTWYYGFTRPQTASPDAAGFVQATTDARGVTLATETTPLPEIRVVVGGRALRPGERIRVVFGAGRNLTAVQDVAERGGRFWLLVDGDGDGVPAPLDASPEFDVLAGETAHVVAHLPSTARPGSSVRLVVAAVDPSFNPSVHERRSFTLSGLESGLSRADSKALSFSDGGLATVDLVVEREGVHRVSVQAGDGLVAVTNPLVVSAGPRIVWGDLHGHSQISDGAGTPEDYFRYARDVSRMEVSALTDHDHYGAPRYLDQHPELWEKIRDTVRAFHAPGEFVTLLGYEWTSWLHGHRHVLYFEEDGPVLSSLDPATESPQGLWRALTGRSALTVGHHSAGSTIALNWAYPPDPVLEPVTEIVSTHGSSEAADSPAPVQPLFADNTVRVGALGRGYVLGFVGSEDSHEGHPGCPREGTELRCGLAAIMTEELSRAGVYEALRARRAYATNGPRIVMRVTLDGKPMGSLIPAGGSHQLEIEIVAVRPLASLEIIQAGGVAERVPTLSQREIKVSRSIGPMAPGSHLYVRAIQVDDGAAWSSPFFFE